MRATATAIVTPIATALFSKLESNANSSSTRIARLHTDRSRAQTIRKSDRCLRSSSRRRRSLPRKADSRPRRDGSRRAQAFSEKNPDRATATTATPNNSGSTFQNRSTNTHPLSLAVRDAGHGGKHPDPRLFYPVGANFASNSS